MSRSFWLFVLIPAVVLLALLSPRLPGWYWTFRSDNPVRRGASLAQREGCLSCHAAFTGREHDNPGSRWGSVPSFFGGNLAMYIRSTEEVENWIARGKARPEQSESRSDHHNDERQDQVFHMHAFEDRLDQEEIRDLAAFVLAADGYLLPYEGPVARGADTSLRFGCESCHGVAGSGGVVNRRSFTGTVPGWLGPDFDHLVNDRIEFDEWVLEGRSERWRDNRPASFFLDRANLPMPSFRKHLTSDDLDDLWSYVQWSRRSFGEDGGSALGIEKQE